MYSADHQRRRAIIQHYFTMCNKLHSSIATVSVINLSNQYNAINTINTMRALHMVLAKQAAKSCQYRACTQHAVLLC